MSIKPLSRFATVLEGLEQAPVIEPIETGSDEFVFPAEVLMTTNAVSADIIQHSEAVEEANRVTEALEAIHTQMKLAHAQGGMTAVQMRPVVLAVEHLRQRVGYTDHRVSLEHFAEEGHGTALEGFIKTIGDTIVAILKAIVNTVKTIAQKIHGFFFSRKAVVERQTTFVDQLKERAERAVGREYPEKIPMNKTLFMQALVVQGKPVSAHAVLELMRQYYKDYSLDLQTVRKVLADHVKAHYPFVKDTLMELTKEGWNAGNSERRVNETLHMVEQMTRAVPSANTHYHWSVDGHSERATLKMPFGGYARVVVMPKGVKAALGQGPEVYQQLLSHCELDVAQVEHVQVSGVALTERLTPQEVIDLVKDLSKHLNDELDYDDRTLTKAINDIAFDFAKVQVDVMKQAPEGRSFTETMSVAKAAKLYIGAMSNVCAIWPTRWASYDQRVISALLEWCNQSLTMHRAGE